MTKVNKKVIKSEKGITILILVITVAILAILTATLATRSNNSVQLSNLTKLQNDIEVLNDRIAVYFIETGELPTYGNKISRDSLKTKFDDLASLDGDSYYLIDLSKLSNLSLNYGKGTTENDKYIINEESHVVYYVQGITYSGTIYHTTGANV